MKKLTALVLSLFLFAGCSGSKTTVQSNKKNTSYVSQEQMENTLKSDGWNVQTTTAASFHLWEQMNPTFMILAENLEEQVCLVAAFRTSELADAAYQSLVPSGDDHVSHENTDLYDEAIVTLDGDQGSWLVRCGGNDVMAGWMSKPEQKSEYETLFTSLQQDPSKQGTLINPAPAENKTETQESSDQNLESEEEAVSEEVPSEQTVTEETQGE